MSQPTHDPGGEPPPQVTVGLVADPDAPAELAEELAEDMPGLLAEQIDPNVRWSVQVVRDPMPAALLDSASILDVTRDRKIRASWDIAICLTDLPLFGDGRPLAVDADTADRVALVSMPALGGIFLRRRLRRSIVRLVRDLMRVDTGPVVPERTAPLKRAVADEDLIDLRIVGSAARGRLRLLLGMVRANTPWRLIPALAKALAAALATSAVVLVNGTLWNVSTAIAAERLAVVSVFSTAIMVAWLIVHRHLWERPDSPSRQDREKAALYNASTVVTLSLGVLGGLLGLFVVDFAVASFLIESGVLANQVKRPVGFSDYARLAWLASSAAIVGGALGSEFESDEAVRRAAYGKRERLRREQAERRRKEAESGTAPHS
ncbi:hypothetical protein [Streptomyces javensis]|uniref:Integral membrane protein n=1 Tax=Streptomyces javensis TaxID=114698 RepID=A0ABS0RAB7_9ACTN|nr:hypothetical protein [Streptomyces javensis]MBI0314033.1 hypothetical protein [Streptomyces javensis]